METNFIRHNQPLITNDDKRAVENVLSTNWIAQGQQVEQLESTFSTLYKTGTACAVSNGTSALYLALKMLGAGKNSYVALPTYACSALLNAIFLTGAKPVLVDILSDSFCIDCTSLDKDASQAEYVIAVHTFGSIANLQELRYSNKYIIEDCCQAFGADTLKDNLGRESHAAIFSFYATKLIAGGQGGLVWSRDKSLISNIFDYRQFDCREEYVPRFNFQMTDINAALINSQINRLEENCIRRQKIAAQYNHYLHSSLTVQMGTCETGGVPYRFVLRAETSELRDKLLAHMRNNDIECTIPIQRYELLHRYLNLDPTLFPNAERTVDTTLSLPIHAGLSDNDVNYVSETLAAFMP